MLMYVWTATIPSRPLTNAGLPEAVVLVELGHMRFLLNVYKNGL